MDLFIVNGNRSIPLWSHFLLNRWDVTIEERAAGAAVGPTYPLTKGADGFRTTLSTTTAWLRLSINATCVIGSASYQLLSIRQDFEVVPATGSLRELTWKKGPPSDPLGFQKVGRHPLLTVAGGTVALDVRFVDITSLFTSLHGQSPWLRAMNYLRRKTQTVRVLASLGGHPLVWHVVVPDVCAPLPEVKPAVMVMPADYGAIAYENSLRGLQSPSHGVSVGNIQSGLEILARTLLEPLSDERYKKLLAGYVALRKIFGGPVANQPAALHHFRGVLTYQPSGGELVPQYWDPPCGLERAIEEHHAVLMLPIMNGGEGGVLISSRVSQLTANAIQLLYSHSNLLVHDAIHVAKPVLIAYSQSGGNVFTSADRDITGIRGLLLLEPQYMNEYLGKEDRRLSLGKTVIQRLLDSGTKVVVVGRYKERPRKYLPNGRSDGIATLPDDANYHVLAYPIPAAGTMASLHPLVARRYLRLVAGGKDTAIGEILGSEDPSTIDQPTVDSELKVDGLISSIRKGDPSDESLVRRVFAAKYEPDDSGAYYPHSLILTGGQTLDAATGLYRSFLHEGLAAIG